MPEEPKSGENADNLMSYVTQGAVQVECATETEVGIFISPTPDYAVKHNGQDYIVLIGDGSPQPRSQLLQLFEKKTKRFSIQGECLIAVVIQAAFQKTKIEIRMNADCTKIEALKVPAMP